MITNLPLASRALRTGNYDNPTVICRQRVQRDLNKEELFWIVEQSLKTPYYIASNLFASGMFSNYMAEAKQIDETLPALNIHAEHWAETAVSFTQKHFPNIKTEVLGGHLMFWEHPDKFNKLIDDFIGSL